MKQLGNPQLRQAAIQDYVVLRLRFIELLHLLLLNQDLVTTRRAPPNILGHDQDRFTETLMTACITTFVTLADPREERRNIIRLWRILYPERVEDIDNIYSTHIARGLEVMLHFRDKAGAHSDSLNAYFRAKGRLMAEKEVVIEALDGFLSLAILLLKLKSVDVPDLQRETEWMLLDAELAMQGKAFNRKWLKHMGLLESGSFHQKF